MKFGDEEVKKYYEPWDGWYCRICGDTVGCDYGDLLEHINTHTKKELKEVEE